MQDLIKPSSTSGRVEPQHVFEAHAPEATIVKDVYVHVGEQVRPGQLLVALDDTNARARLAAATAALRAAEAGYQSVESGGTHQEQLALSSNLAKAQIDCDQAARNLDVVQKLAAKGAAAPSEVAQAQVRLSLAKASLHALEEQKTKPFAPVDLTRARSSVAEAQAACCRRSPGHRAIQCARSLRRLRFIRFPPPATDMSSPEAEILEAADLSKLQVRAYFDEPEIGDLKLNDPVSIVWDAKPDMKFHGHITRLPSTIITYGTRNRRRSAGERRRFEWSTFTQHQCRGHGHHPRGAQRAHRSPRGSAHRGWTRLCLRGLARHLHRAAVEVGAINLTMVQIVSGLKERTVVALGTTNGAPISEGVPIRIVN